MKVKGLFLTHDPASYYDDYWRKRDLERSRARSLGRASIGLRLLGEKRGRLLEVGCGPGWALERFREAGFDVKGLDASAAAIQAGRERGLTADLMNLETGELGRGHDVVAALEVLEHVAHPLDLLQRMIDALAPDGFLLVSLPNEFSLPRRLAILLGRPGFGGHDDPHLRHFDPASARRLFRDAGLEVLHRAWDGLCPPRWKLLKRLTDPLAQWLPGLFSISGIYVLKPGRK